MSGEGSERRKAQRVTLESPIAAKLGDETVSMEEIGLVGARGQCSRELEVGSTLPYSFDWHGDQVRLDGRVARCRLQEQVSEALGELRYDLGIEFMDPTDQQDQQLRDVVMGLVTGMLEAQKANARGEHWSDSIHAETPAANEQALFTSCRFLSSGSWQVSTIMKPVQPRDGFTVRQSTSDEELQKLKQSYANGSEEERNLIRVMAEISARG